MAFCIKDKLVFYTMMGNYTGVIVCLLLIPIIGILFAGIIIAISINLSLILLNRLNSILYKKLLAEIKDIPFWSGWIINEDGNWYYFDFGILKKEEMVISDDILENINCTKAITANTHIYKICPFQKYHRIWHSDYFIVILPSSYEDSMTYDIGTLSYRGYDVEIEKVAPYVLVKVGTIYDNVPIYFMITCSYTLKSYLPDKEKK